MGAALWARRLPVGHVQAGSVLAAHLAEVEPDLVLAFGLHAGHEIRLERVGLNVDYTGMRRSDNDGAEVH